MLIHIEYSFFILIMYQYAQLLNYVYTNYKVKYLLVLYKIVSIFAMS